MGHSLPATSPVGDDNRLTMCVFGLSVHGTVTWPLFKRTFNVLYERFALIRMHNKILWPG